MCGDDRLAQVFVLAMREHFGPCNARCLAGTDLYCMHIAGLAHVEVLLLYSQRDVQCDVVSMLLLQ